MLQFNDVLCLFIVLASSGCSEIFIVSTTFVTFLWAICNSMVSRGKIPNNNLTIEATTAEHIRILWMELNSCYFDWGLKNMA
jgi:hypothetical protein